MLAARIDLTARGAQGLERGPLGHRRDTVYRVQNQLTHPGHEWFMGYRIAHSPTGHPIALRKGVSRDGAFGHAWQGCNREVLPLINQILIRFVCNHDQVMLTGKGGHFFRFRAREDRAGGVLRGVVINGPGIWRGEVLQRPGKTCAARRRCRHQQSPRLAACNHLPNRRPIGREEQHVVSRVEHRLKGNI